jgi:hypothetical protein
MKNKIIFLAVLIIVFLPLTAQAATELRQENFHAGIGLFYFPTSDTKPANCYVEAANLLGVASGYLIPSDTVQVQLKRYPWTFTTITEPALRLAAGGLKIPLSFRNLSKGVYFIRVLARVNNTIPRIRKPLYLHLKINDGPSGEIHDYRMRVNYDVNLEETGRIFFNCLNETNNLDAELYLGQGSQEELLVHRLEFYDALAGTAKVGLKQTPGTFTFAERDYARRAVQEIASHGTYEKDENGNIYGDMLYWKWIHYPYSWKNLTLDQRKSRDDMLWNAMVPLNTMHAFNVDPALASPPGMTAAESEALYGRWEIDTSDFSRYWIASGEHDRPWKIVNRKLGLEYTFDDYMAHRPLPDPYPWKDDGFGYYFPGGAGATYNSPGTYYFVIAPLLFFRIYPQYFGALYNHEGGQDLALRYHVTGDLDVARDAAFALVRFVMQWPAMHYEAQDLGVENTAQPELTWGMNSRWEGRRVGKFSYSGWSGNNAQWLALAYDRLFDFIKDNQEFAGAIHRYVPWVNTPQDVVTLLDTYLLQINIADETVARSRGGSMPLQALVQNPNTISSPWMDASKLLVDNYPLGVIPAKTHYYNSFNQDGTNFIGSVLYTKGEHLLDMVDQFKRYKDLGGIVKYDFSDLNAYPKFRAVSEFLVSATVAGGYIPSVGDASGAPYSARVLKDGTLTPFVRNIWRYTKMSKAAWLVKNVYGGRTFETDSDWQEIEDAAYGIRDPRLSSDSKVLSGFGLGILESGIEKDDYRLKRAVVLRVGTGVGHSHSDALDINFYSLGLRMANDFGQRNEGSLFTLPPDSTSYTHNTVEVDGYLHPWKSDTSGWPPGSFSRADTWVDTFKPGNEGAQFISGAAKSADHNNVSIFRRDVALIDFDSIENSYIFDVFRVGGGKWHTWCFHGADSGIEQGGFTVNASLVQVSDDRAASDSASYLRKHANGRKLEGISSGRVEAVWRLSRTSTTTSETDTDYVNSGTPPLSVTTVAAEQSMLGSDYNASSPRKYTKVTLFDHPDENILVGNLFSAAYKMNIPILYVQQRQPVTTYAAMQEKQNVYPAIIEAYEGDSNILNSRSLSIENNETDALKAVALEVTTKEGRKDTLFSDGRNVLRSIDNAAIMINGKFGCYSEDASGFKSVKLVGASELVKGNISIKPDASMYKGTIASVDYKNKKICLNETWPENILNGQELHIYNSDRHCAYKLENVTNAGSGSVLSFNNPAEAGELGIKTLTADTAEVDYNLVLADNANRNKGFTATNEKGTKAWKLQKTTDYKYKLIGSLPVLSDFTDEDSDGKASIMVYDFGAGDSVEIPTSVLLKKTGQDIYLIKSDTAVTITLPGTGRMLAQSEGGAYRDVTTATATATVTGYLDVAGFAAGEQNIKFGAQGDIIYGDVSSDGSLSAYDASLAAQYAAGLISLSADQIKAADVTGDASVSAYDASLIAQKAVGLITKFSVEG